jgi:xanthine dehydrogenase accessory factor
MTLRIWVRGGGDLASGAVIRLWRAGWQVLVTELPEPMAVRRSVSFSQAVYDHYCKVEEATGVCAASASAVDNIFDQRKVAVMVDPEGEAANWFNADVELDARMTKRHSSVVLTDRVLRIGLGPGFVAGENCHAAVETKRGPDLGRVIWKGSTEADTRIPDTVKGFREERVLRAPVDGHFLALQPIGSILKKDQVIAEVEGQAIFAPFDGVLRGILQSGIAVLKETKIGDLDPRMEPALCWKVSDKALAIGGGVIEAILSWEVLRKRMWL